MGRASKQMKPTPEQLTNGSYARKFVMHVETATEAMTHISRHDPVERWIASGRLEDSQVSAIRLCQRLWDIAGIHQSVTANYGERIPGMGTTEGRSNREIDARRDLHRIQDYFTGLERYWSIFERVCRHGEAAGVAGTSLGYGDRSAQDRAHTIVCFVADVIAMKERL